MKFLHWFTGIMDFNVFIGARAGVSKNVAVNGNATTGLAITPKMEKAKKSLENEMS